MEPGGWHGHALKPVEGSRNSIRRDVVTPELGAKSYPRGKWSRSPGAVALVVTGLGMIVWPEEKTASSLISEFDFARRSF